MKKETENKDPEMTKENEKGDSRSILAQRLCDLRKMGRMTQQRLSELLHLDRSTYAYYETGKTAPTYDTLKRLSRVFGVSVDFLLGNTDDTEIVAVRQPSMASPWDSAVTLAALPEDERSFLVSFRQLDVKQRSIVQDFVFDLSRPTDAQS